MRREQKSWPQTEHRHWLISVNLKGFCKNRGGTGSMALPGKEGNLFNSKELWSLDGDRQRYGSSELCSVM